MHLHAVSQCLLLFLASEKMMLLHYQPETCLLAPAIHGCYIQEVRGQSGPVVSAVREEEEEEEEDRERQGGGMCVVGAVR